MNLRRFIPSDSFSFSSGTAQNRLHFRAEWQTGVNRRLAPQRPVGGPPPSRAASAERSRGYRRVSCSAEKSPRKEFASILRIVPRLRTPCSTSRGRHRAVQRILEMSNAANCLCHRHPNVARTGQFEDRVANRCQFQAVAALDILQH